jgi:BirA family biotin operon repressor/biotin-[acetyl-CoA-carboxylase] ligase
MFDLDYIKKKLFNTNYSNILYFKELNSTNIYSLENDLPDFTVVLADKQTNGKGRSSRIWESSSDQNLYFSIVLPKMDINRLLPLNIVAGYALCDSVRKYCLNTDLKWPNDLVIEGKKLAGLLLDVKFSGNNLKKVVLGIGINVNIISFPETIKNIATSIKLNIGNFVQREELLADFLIEFEKKLDTLLNGNIDIKALWKDYSANLNKKINIHVGDIKQNFIERGINENGGLIVEDVSGKLSEIYTGDIGYDFCS